MEPIIEMKQVKKAFGEKEVLTGVDFKVYPGEIIGYIGPNGAGKSTTVKIIMGLLSQDSGEIHIFGDLLQANQEDYKKRIGYVPENADLYETLTAAEYLIFMGQLYGVDEKTVLHTAYQMMTALGIESSFHARLETFSKGMRQKVLIISSLLHDPDVLFWDEPLNGLDANSVLVIKEILVRLKERGKTIFYSSHIMETVEKLSDRILILNNGQVVADGSFKEIAQEADSTLEHLFNQLTGFNEQGELADAFIGAMKGEASYE